MGFAISPIAQHRSASAAPLAFRTPQPIALGSDGGGGTGGLNRLSVGELKSLLTERGIDFRDCLEKRDLIERLEQSKPSSSSFARRPASGLTESEGRTVSVFKDVSPAVAYIQTTLQSPQTLFSLRPMEYKAGSGSGFLWDVEGHVVTKCVASLERCDIQGRPPNALASKVTEDASATRLPNHAEFSRVRASLAQLARDCGRQAGQQGQQQHAGASQGVPAGSRRASGGAGRRL